MYKVTKYWPNFVHLGESNRQTDIVNSIEEALNLPWLHPEQGRLEYNEKWKDIRRGDWIVALVTFIHDSCINEKCRMCGVQASHKVVEDVFNESRHGLSAYVCDSHFIEVFGRI
jgi:hypothetical protein